MNSTEQQHSLEHKLNDRIASLKQADSTDEVTAINVQYSVSRDMAGHLHVDEVTVTVSHSPKVEYKLYDKKVVVSKGDKTVSRYVQDDGTAELLDELRQTYKDSAPDNFEC